MKQKRKESPLIPVDNSLAAATKAIASERLARQEACDLAIRQAFADHRCRLIITRTETNEGKVHWTVSSEALP